MAVDPAFGVDSFNKPKVLQEDETIVNNILTVLFGRPGFYPSIPTLGLDITQYLYSFQTDLDVNKLLAKLSYQCSDFATFVDDGTLSCQYYIYKDSPVLVFVLPKITKNSNTLVLALTTNSLGQPTFNFTFNKSQAL